MLELAAERNVQEYLLLDHDILAGPRVGELIGRPQPEFGAVENRRDQLVSVFGPGVVVFVETHAGLPVEEWRYFNTGVVSLDGSSVAGLAGAWPSIALGAVRQLGDGAAPRPLSNLTMSIAAAALGLRIESYPPEFNQRNYGDLHPSPILVHYNNWDPVNVSVKSDELETIERFLLFLSSTDNRFWVRRLRRHVDEPAPTAGSCIAFVCARRADPPVE